MGRDWLKQQNKKTGLTVSSAHPWTVTRKWHAVGHDYRHSSRDAVKSISGNGNITQATVIFHVQLGTHLLGNNCLSLWWQLLSLHFLNWMCNLAGHISSFNSSAENMYWMCSVSSTTGQSPCTWSTHRPLTFGWGVQPWPNPLRLGWWDHMATKYLMHKKPCRKFQGFPHYIPEGIKLLAALSARTFE